MSVMETLKAVKEEEAVALSGVLVAVRTFLEEVRASPSFVCCMLKFC